MGKKPKKRKNVFRQDKNAKKILDFYSDENERKRHLEEHRQLLMPNAMSSFYKYLNEKTCEFVIPESDLYQLVGTRIDIVMKGMEGEFFIQRGAEVYDWLKRGVIKLQPFIAFLMEKNKWSKQDAIKYIAQWYGMKPGTQSGYLSGGFETREDEKKKTRTRRKLHK